MVDGKPRIFVMFVGSERDNPCWLTHGFARGVLLETEIWCAFFIGHKLTVIPGGERFVAQDVAKLRKMFDQVFKLFGIVPIPRCGSEPVDHTSVDVDADVEFDTVLASIVSLDPNVVPSAAVVGAESRTVNSDVHLFPTKKPGHPVHHLAYVGDRESVHPALDHAMSWKNRASFSNGFTVLDMCFDTVVGLIESYFEKTSYCYGLWVMSFSPFFVGFPWRWKLVYRFDYCLGEISGEIAVDIVRNYWINSFLCASHPAKKRGFSP